MGHSRGYVCPRVCTDASLLLVFFLADLPFAIDISVVNCMIMAGRMVPSHEQIKAAVMMGQRPDLNAVTGPVMLVTLVKDCISRCWHQLPDSRPSFAGKTVKIVLHVRVGYFCIHCSIDSS